MESYYIFKTDNRTGKTIHICNGSHDTEHECRIHWQSYMYGFMDGATELLGGLNFGMESGTRENSFRITYQDKLDVEYFVIFGEEGHKLIFKLCQEEGNHATIED